MSSAAPQTLRSFGELSKAFAPTPQGPAIAKRKKFGWDDPGPLPRIEWVSKHDLQVDHENYQRPYSHGRALAIARKFNWKRFETLTVARRPDGKLWVIEGQHRKGGADLRDDIDQLPCCVYDLDAIKTEAAAFVEIGTGSKPLTSLDKFQPSVTMGDTAALLVAELLDASGYKAADQTSGKSAKCVGVLQNLAKADPEALKKCWGLIIAAHHGEALHNRIVQALFYLFKISEGKIDQNPYRKRIVARGRMELVADAGRAAAFYSAGGPKVWAAGIAAVMSKGLPDDRKILVELRGGSVKT